MAGEIEFVNTRLIVTDEEMSGWLVSDRNSDGLPLEITGDCPSCGHETKADLALTLVASLQSVGAGQAPLSERMTRVVECACGHTHPIPTPPATTATTPAVPVIGPTTAPASGGAAAASGGAPTQPAAPASAPPVQTAGTCGRWWLVSVLLHAHAGKQAVFAGDERLLVAAQAAHDAVLAEEKTVRTSAEKWTGGVVALLALLGLSGAVIGKDSFDGLPTAAKVLAVICIAAAAVLAGAAVLLSYRAAYGWPADVDISNDLSLSTWFESRRTKLSTAAGDLRHAVVFAAFVPAALLVAAGILWLWPRSTPQALVKVTRFDASFVCGHVLGSTDDAVFRIRTTNGAVSAVEPSSISKVELVDGCSP